MSDYKNDGESGREKERKQERKESDEDNRSLPRKRHSTFSFPLLPDQEIEV